MPIRCHLKFSNLWAASLLVLHLVALFVVWLTSQPPTVALLLSAAVIISFAYYSTMALKRLRDPNRSHFAVDKNEISFFDGSKIKWQGVVLPQTLVTPYFVLLSAKSPRFNTRYFELIFCDAMSADEFRQLRTVLRLS